MQRALDSFAVAGVAVAMVKDGKIVHEKGYGLRTIEESTPVDAHTNFGIASNSKAFTTTALALLVEEGKLQWTDHVVDHIPEFRMYNEYVTRHFNIQDLLTHRSGLGLGAGAGAVDVGNYTGEYEDPWFGKVDITERNGTGPYTSGPSGRRKLPDQCLTTARTPSWPSGKARAWSTPMPSLCSAWTKPEEHKASG